MCTTTLMSLNEVVSHARVCATTLTPGLVYLIKYLLAHIQKKVGAKGASRVYA